LTLASPIVNLGSFRNSPPTTWIISEVQENGLATNSEEIKRSELGFPGQVEGFGLWVLHEEESLQFGSCV